MATEGLDTESVCRQCKLAGIQPITITAVCQSCGNPDRAVRYFCARCQSVHDEAALKFLPPCPLPLPVTVLQAVCTVPVGTLPHINCVIDYDTLEA